MTSTARFPIRFDPLFRRFGTLFLMRPADSFVEVRGGEVRVRMGVSFSTSFPRSAVRSASAYDRRPLSRGVHGLAGRWLVNGSGQGIVSVRVEPDQRAHLLGVPIRLRELLVSVEDPAALIAALHG